MDRNELFGHLKEYGSTVNSGNATTQHFIDIKNKIREAYDAGSIDKNTMKQLGETASGVFKNMGKAKTIQGIPEKIVQKGGLAGQVEGMKSIRFPSVTNALESASNAGKIINEDLAGSKGAMGILPALGLGAAALGSLGIAKKVQTGDYGNAALDATDLATDFIPGVGIAKMILKPSEVGAADLPDDIMKEKEAFNATHKADLPKEIPDSQFSDSEKNIEDNKKQSPFKNTFSRIK